MAICCKGNKAKIYYNVPVDGGIKIKKYGESKWTTITGIPPYTYECLAKGHFVTTGTIEATKGSESNVSGKSGLVTISGNAARADPWGYIPYTAYLGYINGVNLSFTDLNYYNDPNKPYCLCSLTGGVTGWQKYPVVTLQEGYYLTETTFVLSDATGEIYRFECSVCPEVQEVGWHLDPANEKSVEVELRRVIVRECLNWNLVEQTHSIVVIKQTDTTPPVATGVVLTVPYNPDCPINPTVRIVCADDGKHDKECPPGTCTIDCGNHRCCFDQQGKLVRSIKL